MKVIEPSKRVEWEENEENYRHNVHTNNNSTTREGAAVQPNEQDDDDDDESKVSKENYSNYLSRLLSSPFLCLMPSVNESIITNDPCRINYKVLLRFIKADQSSEDSL